MPNQRPQAPTCKLLRSWDVQCSFVSQLLSQTASVVPPSLCSSSLFTSLKEYKSRAFPLDFEQSSKVVPSSLPKSQCNLIFFNSILLHHIHLDWLASLIHYGSSLSSYFSRLTKGALKRKNTDLRGKTEVCLRGSSATGRQYALRQNFSLFLFDL